MQRSIWILTLGLICTVGAAAGQTPEASYHGQLSLGSGVGMLEKWCPLPNFSFEKQGGIGDGSFGWTAQSCNDCHIGAEWNPTRPSTDCYLCHEAIGDAPTVDACMTCHSKDTAKRGDVFTAEEDVHIAAGMVCQDCHVKVADATSDHQFLKGRIIDTTDTTMEGTISCATCHERDPHAADTRRGRRLNRHVRKVACETCHTGERLGAALESRAWNRFTAEGKPVTVKRAPGWLPTYKWWDGGRTDRPSHPFLEADERRDYPRAKIHPFNEVLVSWFVTTPESAIDDIIIVPEVKAADADLDGTVTVEEMQATYPGATLLEAVVNFNVSHSVQPAAEAYMCRDCHRNRGGILDWEALGYDGNPAPR